MRWLAVILFSGSLVSAQEQISVSNAASMLAAGTAAAGSLVLIGLNPQAGGPFTIDPTSVNVTILPNGANYAAECGIIPTNGDFGQFVNPFQVLAVLPTILPLGPAQLTLYNSGFNATAQITIVPSSPGLFPPSGAFMVQEMGADQVQKPNQLTQPAQPGDTVTLWGTGLGSATQVTVLLGGRATTATSAGPAPGMPGVDQIQFVVPADASIPNDCYVAVAVQTPGVTSNTISISKTSDGSPCQSTLGLTTADLATLDGGGTVGLAQLTVSALINPPLPRSPFGAWFNTGGARGFNRTESALFYAIGMTALGVAEISGTAIADDAFFGCTVSPLFPGELGVLGGGKSYAVGSVVKLQGSGEVLDLTSPLPPPDFFFAGDETSPTVLNPSQLPPPFFDPGTWTFSGSGGAGSPQSIGVLPFSVPLTVPPEIMATNFNAWQTINRQTDLVVMWNPTGFGEQDVLTSTLSGSTVPGGPNTGQTTVICNVPATSGQLAIPAAMLQNLAPSALVAVGGAYMELSVARRQGHAQTFSLPLPEGSSVPAVLQFVSFETWPVAIQ